jgi:DNA-binding transcriptional ArsR family regulator
MKALSEPNRVKILKILQCRDLCGCEIQAILDIAQPTVSSHLKVLEDAGLVSYQGRFMGELPPFHRQYALWRSYARVSSPLT